MSSVLVIKKNQDVANPEAVPEGTSYLYTEENTFHETLKAHSTSSSTVYEKIIIVELTPDDDTQAILFKLLVSKGKLMIDGIVDRESGQRLSTDLKIQGFLDIMAVKDPSSGRRFLVCQKPDWEVGSAAKLNLAPAAPPAAPINNVDTTKWKLNELAEDELVDENALLEESTVPTPANQLDCGEGNGGKKRACANCTCGLAEEEAKDNAAERANMTVEEKVVKSSSCGNCYKGDAFRCASCPFLGKPSFEPGQEKLVLSLADDDI
jgi:hypothetical protein